MGIRPGGPADGRRRPDRSAAEPGAGIPTGPDRRRRASGSRQCSSSRRHRSATCHGRYLAERPRLARNASARASDQETARSHERRRRNRRTRPGSRADRPRKPRPSSSPPIGCDGSRHRPPISRYHRRHADQLALRSHRRSSVARSTHALGDPSAERSGRARHPRTTLRRGEPALATRPERQRGSQRPSSRSSPWRSDLARVVNSSPPPMWSKSKSSNAS